MRGVYTSAVQITGVTAAKTLLYITAPANKVVELLSVEITGVGSNVTLQNLDVGLFNVTTLGTPTASSNTPQPEEAGDQAAGSTVKTNVTASEPTYSTTPLDRGGGPNIGACYRHSPTPEERIVIGGGATVGLRLLNAISSQDLNVQAKFREIG
jgi:hypothetical protein